MNGSIVLDASALIAMLKEEPGGDQVAEVIKDCCMCVVNFAEVISYFAFAGYSQNQVAEILRPLPIDLVPADADLSWAAGLLRPKTKQAGLSLGDRYCLALAKRNDSDVLTADQSWEQIADDVGVRVRLIR